MRDVKNKRRGGKEKGMRKKHEKKRKRRREEEMLCWSTLPCVVFEQGEYVLGWCVDHTVTHHTCVLRTWTYSKEFSKNGIAVFAFYKLPIYNKS